jgi:hypothetical protein
MKRPLYLLALLLPLLSLPAHATFRCGQKLVNEGDRITEVLRKCGQPASRDLLGYTDTINGNLGLQIEEWSYGPNNGMYYYLTFEGGRLRTIETKRGQ